MNVQGVLPLIRIKGAPLTALLRVGGMRTVLVLLYHLAVISFALAGAFLLRFDFMLSPRQVSLLLAGLLIAVPLKMVVFRLFDLHQLAWRFVSPIDLGRIVAANLAASAAFVIAALLVIGESFPRSIYVLDLVLCLGMKPAARLAVRLLCESLAQQPCTGRGRRRVIIYGAGSAGLTLLREIRSNPSLGYAAVGFVDDDPAKSNTRFMGLLVLGTGHQLPLIVERLRMRRYPVDEIVLALPEPSGRAMREAIANCRAAHVPCKRIPSVDELLNGQVLTRQLREISVADILGREPVQLELDKIRKELHRRSVLVTGGAGSIGSELCRQIAAFQPSTLVILDVAESPLFQVEMELRRKHPELNLRAEIGDIRDIGRVDEILEAHEIQTIFHAAAYKHVPLMEAHILEAARNNVLGTWNLVRAAAFAGVPNFLMISSDKAVNPTSVMGVTKRIAELIVAAMASATRPSGSGPARFVSVRFGNVLGSNGSVVPIFQSLIAAREPLPVTHPEMRRYFMSIPEAVQLVLQASTMGNCNEIFVLDMGEPVKIVDLARNMIRLAGLEPDEDIEIRFTGMRPGEKLYEELSIDGEQFVPTNHHKIRIFKGAAPTRSAIENWIAELERLVAMRSAADVVDHLLLLVPEYQGAWVRKPATREQLSEARHRSRAAAAR